jgi:hypothetical protein
LCSGHGTVKRCASALVHRIRSTFHYPIRGQATG